MADVIAFLKKKIRTNAFVLDYNKDGILTKEDFEMFSDRYMSLGKATEKKGRCVRALLRKYWQEMVGDVNAITYEAYAETLLTRDQVQLSKLVIGITDLFFDVMDVNDDDLIDLSEFTEFYVIIDRDEEMALRSFTAMDTDNDHLLSRGDFLAAIDEFFVGVDQTSPYQLFFGDLI